MASQLEILKMLEDKSITVEEAAEKLAKLKVTVTYKVSEQGGISFYGLRRFPITMYREELEEIIKTTQKEDFKKFLVDNENNLSKKQDKQKEKKDKLFAILFIDYYFFIFECKKSFK